MGLLSKTTPEIEEILNSVEDIDTTITNTFNTMFVQKMLSIYPVGAIYMSTSSTSPASLFGGTWEQIQNRFLLAAGSSYTAGSTGGASTVTLTSSQIPGHTHSFSATTPSGGQHGHYIVNVQNVSGGDSIYSMKNKIPPSNASTTNIGEYYNVIYGYANAGISAHTHSVSGTTGSTGGGSSHSNMPPYLVVYVWKRTA